jgi:hypothetical protein
MTAEGWEGKSLRHHVEAAHGLAQDAHTIAQGIEEKLDALLGAIERVGAGQADILAVLDLVQRRLRLPIDPKSALPEQAATTADPKRSDAQEIERGSLFAKVKRIKSEIGAWRHFMSEVATVRAALREWRTLDEGAERRHD